MEIGHWVNALVMALAAGGCLLLWPASLPVGRRRLAEWAGHARRQARESHIGRGIRRGRTAWQAVALEREIEEGIALLRTLIAIGGSHGGTDALLEELIRLDGRLAPAYRSMLRLVRGNDTEQAAACFAAAVGTEAADEYARILLQWDRIRPRELLEALISQQRSLREKRKTRQMERDAVLSDVLYLPVVTGLMLVFLNFIFVAYVFEQQAILDSLL